MTGDQHHDHHDEPWARRQRQEMIEEALFSIPGPDRQHRALIPAMLDDPDAETWAVSERRQALVTFVELVGHPAASIDSSVVFLRCAWPRMRPLITTAAVALPVPAGWTLWDLRHQRSLFLAARPTSPSVVAEIGIAAVRSAVGYSTNARWEPVEDDWVTCPDDNGPPQIPETF